MITWQRLNLGLQFGVISFLVLKMYTKRKSLCDSVVCLFIYLAGVYKYTSF